MGLGKPILTLNDPNGLKNTTNVYSIHLELQMALSCQISTGKWKYVNRSLDFLSIPDQCTVCVKRLVRPGWTYIRRLSVTPDLISLLFLASTKQLYEWFSLSVCPSVWLSLRTSVTSFSLGTHLLDVCLTEVKTQLRRFRTVTPVWIDIWWWNDAQTLMLLWRGALLFFDVIRQISRSCSSKKSSILTQFGCFRTVTPVWIHQWSRNDAQSLHCHRRGAPLFFKVIRQIPRSHGTKHHRFWPEWAFPDCNSSLNSSMALKWCTKLELGWQTCPIVFQGHPSNFKVTRDRKLPILTRIEHFRTVIPVRIHRWLWKDAKNLK